ncbi:hypothetical protein K7432_009717 [Basidiobolus ranarum]|uniref:ELMO domain-containing protein n=1 Tax=Basidiobolus ranarum TaxID=34480 RepID=A0ABR2VWM1_9FUNG
MQSSSDGEILKHFPELQCLFIRDLNRKKRSNPFNYPKQGEMLNFIWEAASIPTPYLQIDIWLALIQVYTQAINSFDPDRNAYQEVSKGRLLGFLANRHFEHCCPFAKMCIEVIELLCDYWNINVSYTTAVQPLLLVFDNVHDITVKAFFRMWTEMKATFTDFAKVSVLIRSQIFFTLKDEPQIYLYQFEQSMLEVPYHVVRERQLEELEQEDDFLSKLAVRNLRERLYKESYQFVKEKRISCLLNGA